MVRRRRGADDAVVVPQFRPLKLSATAECFLRRTWESVSSGGGCEQFEVDQINSPQFCFVFVLANWAVLEGEREQL